MSKKTYHLFPIFRSDTMTRLTARLYLNGASETITALAAALDVSVSAVSQIVPALEKGQLVTVTRFGTAKLVAANTNAPFYRPLRDLLEIVAGPPVVLAEELGAVAGIRDLFIFGSYAARASGVPGRQPKDIDVLVVGAPDRLDVVEASVAATARLGREVNALIRSAEDWDSREDAFLRNLALEPMIRISCPPGGARPVVARTTSDRALPEHWEDVFLRGDDTDN